MEVQGAYFRGCYTALIADCDRGARRAVSQVQVIVCKLFCGRGYRQRGGWVFRWGDMTGDMAQRLDREHSDRVSCVHGGIPLDSIVRFSELIQCKVGSKKIATALGGMA